MTTDGRPARPIFGLPALAAAVSAIALLSACGSAAGARNAADTAPVGSSPATSSRIPTQDVVAAVKPNPVLRAELPAAIRGSGSISLGTTLTPGVSGLPHAGQVDGTYVGVDVDLRNAVGKVLGITWTVHNGTFATIIPGVQNGRYDVGQDNFGVTRAREQVVDFAPYLTDGQAILASAEVKLDKVTDLTDLCGLTIATTPGSTFQQLLTAAAGNCAAAGRKDFTVQYFADSAPIFLGLSNGKVDVFFGPTLSLQYDSTHVRNTKFLGQLSSTVVGFVTAKGSPLAKAISDAVNHLIATGDYTRILDKWGVRTGSGIPKSAVNPAATF